MTATAFILTVVVVIIGVVLVATLLASKRCVWARLRADGFQEHEIVVRGRYVPDVISVKRGIPVHLHFRRDEDTPCSERVIFSDFHVGSSLLPAFQTTTVSFIPTRSGEFLFTCAFGMYLGRLVVVEPGTRDLAKVSAAGSIAANGDVQLPNTATISTKSLELSNRWPPDR